MQKCAPPTDAIGSGRRLSDDNDSNLNGCSEFYFLFENLKNQSIILYITNMLSSNRFTQKHIFSLSSKMEDLRKQKNYLLDACALYCDLNDNKVLQSNFIKAITNINNLNKMKNHEIEFVFKDSGKLFTTNPGHLSMLGGGVSVLHYFKASFVV